MPTQFLEISSKEAAYQNGRLYCATGPLGLGLFAGELIEKGSTILVFSGPIIGFDEAVAKGDRECWPLQIDYGKYIDLEAPGCLANHSCEPNAGIKDQGDVTQIKLIALRDISPGEEIRYDYSTTMDEDFFTMPCRCGSIFCRGKVEDFKYLPFKTQKNYLQSELIIKFIAKKESRLTAGK